MGSSSRAVSPIIANILMVAIVVILAATISVFTLGFTEETTETGPIVGQSSGEFVSESSTGSSYDNQIIRITHIAGDTVSVSDMEIVVRACGKTERVVNLPAENIAPTNQPFYKKENFERNNGLLSAGISFQKWNAGVLHEDTSNKFNSGKSFELRIATGICEVDPGNEVQVQVIHTPTNSVIIKETLTGT